MYAPNKPPQLAASSTTGELRDQDGSPISKLIREIVRYRVAAKPISHNASAIRLTTCSGRAFFASVFCNSLAALSCSETLLLLAPLSFLREEF